MLTFPLNEDMNNLDSLVKEYKTTLVKLKRDYPDFKLKTNAVQKFILLTYVIEIVENAQLDKDVSLNKLVASEQDIILISNAFTVAFSEVFALPSDVRLKYIKNLFSNLFVYKLNLFISSNFTYSIGINTITPLASGLRNVIKYGRLETYKQIKEIVGLLLSDKEIDEIKPLI